MKTEYKITENHTCSYILPTLIYGDLKTSVLIEPHLPIISCLNINTRKDKCKKNKKTAKTVSNPERNIINISKAVEMFFF